MVRPPFNPTDWINNRIAQYNLAVKLHDYDGALGFLGDIWDLAPENYFDEEVKKINQMKEQAENDREWFWRCILEKLKDE